MKNIKFILGGLLLSMALMSCGGSSSDDDKNDTGYSGVESPAMVTTTNADDLAVAATTGAKAAIDQELAPTPTGFKPSPQASMLLQLSANLSRDLSRANRTANQTIEGVCSSGTADIEENSDYSKSTTTYNNCVITYGTGGSYTVDGTVTFTINADDSFIFSYQDFTITYLGETSTINMTVECDSDYNCTYVSDFNGLDGRTYRVENSTVSNSGENSYIVSATVYDPDNGSISITADVTYGSCAGGVPVSGSITFTGASGTSGSVTFNDCDSFTVTVDGTSATYSWSDILG